MENWIPIAKYAKKYNLSVSTVRRRIKDNTLEYKKDGNRYLIRDDNNIVYLTLVNLVETQKELLEEKNEKIVFLEEKLRKCKEEKAELEMLVSVLEEDE